MRMKYFSKFKLKFKLKIKFEKLDFLLGEIWHGLKNFFFLKKHGT